MREGSDTGAADNNDEGRETSVEAGATNESRVVVGNEHWFSK